ncbi:MAG: lipoate--protein ligase [Firmicutes bacterium]|nr:lipoate--protein ligase [Bacillota bacterium]
MITKLSLYVTDCVNPYRNLAMEEYLTFHAEPSECILYLWQNQKTVVIGKNQNAWKECNINKLEADGGHLVRRLSGGGAVFHDLGNLNFTFCVREEDYDVDRQLAVILEAVRTLGIDAEKTGRNDITAGGRKFSGNAFYKSGGFCYHHGTLLVDVDQQDMQKYLNVSLAKLQSKGVDSVRSRTVNLKELRPDLTIRMLKEHLADAFCRVYGRDVQPLTEERLNMEEIQGLEERFASQKWRLGRKIPFDHTMGARFAWGEMEIQLHVNGGIIEDLSVYTDAMDGDFPRKIHDAWAGLPYDVTVLSASLDGVEMGAENENRIKQDIVTLLKGENANGQ